MGPWTHGAWAAATWDKYAGYTFGSNTADYFKDIETRFFNYYLKDKGGFNQAEASILKQDPINGGHMKAGLHAM